MILSICIPSYNHLSHLQDIIDSFSLSKSNECELVIVDNGSTEDISSVLHTEDPRIKIFKRKIVIKGPENMGTCIEFGTGKYRLLVIDKDFIDGQFIDRFIDVLKKYPQIKGGKCQLNCNDNDCDYEIIDCRNNKNTKKIIDFFYTEGHPTGYFYSIEGIKVENETLANFKERWNPFNEDMLIARCATLGPMINYKSPLVYSLLGYPVDIKEKSGTYLKANGNLFFEPQSRLHQMILNIRHLETLKVEMRQFKQLLKIIYSSTFVMITEIYALILSQPYLCEHYGIYCRKIHIFEKLVYVRELNKTFKEYDGLIHKSLLNLIVREFSVKIPILFLRSIAVNIKHKFFSRKQKSSNNIAVCMKRWKLN